MPKPGETSAPPHIIKFVMALSSHLSDKHKDEIDRMSTAIQDFVGLATLNHFETSDPAVSVRIDKVRAELHKNTRKFFFTDEAIADIVNRIDLEEDQALAVAAAMRALRDAYEELGDWSPEKHALQTATPA